ncbi:MAG TPA: MerR family transcriptional regulator [Bacillales bacterium]|nr:MerR family transcriptional regulator [Bacillales bacterium]
MTMYKDKKVISIGTVCELTGLSERKIRYYEERRLVFPDRTNKGTRKYSFSDVELLMEIAEQREEGVQTHEIRQSFRKERRREQDIRNELRKGQLNAHFHMRKR